MNQIILTKTNQMKAIKTTYVSATDKKPSRIRASAEGVKSKYYSVNGLQDITKTDRADAWHDQAALFFRDDNRWTYYGGDPAAGVQPLAHGQIGPDTHVHCFVDTRRKDGVIAQARVIIKNIPAPETGLPLTSAYLLNLLKHSLDLLDGKL